jgi:hypothetical protein
MLRPLINLLQNAEFDVKKEAAWAISNATSGGTPEQIRHIVDLGCIKPLCTEMPTAGLVKHLSW